jgi:hypothetical protein
MYILRVRWNVGDRFDSLIRRRIEAHVLYFRNDITLELDSTGAKGYAKKT